MSPGAQSVANALLAGQSPAGAAPPVDPAWALQTLNNPVGASLTPQAPTLAPHPMSLSERLGAGTQDALERAGLSRGNAQEAGRRAQLAGAYVPILGQALSADQAARDAAGGNYASAGLNALGALPLPGASKVAETMAAKGAEEAAPRIAAYHASKDAFDAFDLAKAGSRTDAGRLGHGVYFSTDPNVGRDEPYLYQAALEGFNPLTVQFPKWEADKTALVAEKLGLPSTATPKEITAEARRRGYNGIALDYSPVNYNHHEFAVFDPSVIRDVTRGPGGKPQQQPQGGT